MRNIGLAGCSGVGKSTLAAFYQHKLISGVGFCASVAGDIFRKYGYKQSDTLMSEERLYLQERILDAQIDEYERCERMFGSFIADRTPIDMATFTMLNIGAPEHRRGQAYTARCVSVTKRFFPDGIFVIPSFIPYVQSDTRPPYTANDITRYQGKMGWILKEYGVPHVTMPEITNLDDRFAWLKSSLYPSGKVKDESDGRTRED